jgi:hypothetical protein
MSDAGSPEGVKGFIIAIDVPDFAGVPVASAEQALRNNTAMVTTKLVAI